MRAHILIPLIFGLAGAAVLISLGVWQMQRLTWKETILADIESRVSADSVALPVNPDPERDKYLPVSITGHFGAGRLRVLVSRKQVGAGYLVVSPFHADGRTILVDRGFIRADRTIPDASKDMVVITGNLHWPDDRNSSTPENDLIDGIWFARDIPEMADYFDAEPVLLVVRSLSQSDAPLTPLPVDISSIPNDHLKYVITWFSLAVIWLVMTGYFIIRSRKIVKGVKT